MASKLMSDERLAEQQTAVEKAVNSKMLDKYGEVLLIGENSNIIKAHAGELNNTHNAVFKKCLGKKNCEHCGAEERLDRAHMKSKMEIAKQVLDELHPKPNEPIDMKVFIKEFVMRHLKVGVWMLCRKCHRELG
jgi:hypothetical protein